MPVKGNYDLFFLCEESLSMFPGADHASRFGGAGLQMFLIGTEIAKDERFRVTFVFDGPVGNAHVDNVRIVRRRAPIKRGIPVYSRRLNRQRALEPYVGGDKRALISTMSWTAPALVAAALKVGAKSIFRVAHERDVVGPMRASSSEQAVMLDAIAACDRVVVQADQQKEMLLASRGKASTVIRKGIPAPSEPPDLASKAGILWVSSAQAFKQPWHFLELARDFPDEAFTMIMPPADVAMFEYVQRQAALVPNLDLIDWQVPFTEAQRHFDAARVFVYTSEFGTHPDNTLLQAAVGACTILSQKADPDRGMFSVGHAGVVGDGSYNDLRRRLRQLLDNPAECGQFGLAAFDYVTRVYGLERMADEYKELIIGLF